MNTSPRIPETGDQGFPERLSHRRSGHTSGLWDEDPLRPVKGLAHLFLKSASGLATCFLE
jgi:hypothetical protein